MNISTPLETHIPSLRALWQEAFSDTDAFLNTFFNKAFRCDRCRCVTENGKVVAALYWFDCLYMNRPIAYIYAVATASTHRGQGICRRLMNDTHLHLAKLGYEGAILVPGNMELFKLYEHLGYQICSHIREFSCNAKPEVLSLCPIDTSEYARLRRLLLPQGGVIQENENLDFLKTQAEFYMGPGFLLAVRDEGNKLYGVELLGDVASAPAIVHALGYEKGTFRTLGQGKPFAMYHPLGDSKLLPPAYFGLAFD